MAETSKSRVKKPAAPAEVTFKCRYCGKHKPISEMKIIARFRPIMVVCADCEKAIH